MSSRWTKDDLARVLAKQPRPSKYRNRKTTVDGIVFDSAKEARRWQELRMLEVAGKIQCLQRQSPIALAVPSASGGQTLIGYYVADFTYVDMSTRETVVEDVKGMKTALYRWKKKHLEAQFGIQIRET